MYKSVEIKNYYLIIQTFHKAAKKPPYNYAYLNGFRKWDNKVMKTYALVLGTFRIMFGIKKKEIGCSEC